MYLLIASNWKTELWKEHWTGNQGTSAPVLLLCCVVLGKPLNWLAFGFLWVSWWLRWQRICLQCRSPGFSSWAGKIPWRREWFSLQYSYLENPKTEEPGGLHSSWGGRVGQDWVTHFWFPVCNGGVGLVFPSRPNLCDCKELCDVEYTQDRSFWCHGIA